MIMANVPMEAVSNGMQFEELKDETLTSTKVIEEINYAELIKTKKCALFFKRLFDIFASGFGLLLLTPLFVFVAVLLKCTSKGPVFFKQERVGKDGKPFRIFKFRTMVNGADKKGLLITEEHDVRITKVGKFLRKTKIDELPQLINVFMGKMSLVGPRPQTYFYYDQYDEYQRQQFLIKPGITGTASLFFANEGEILESHQNADANEDKNELYMREIVPKKTQLNLDYIVNMNVFYDVYVIMKTCFKIIKK